MTVQNDKSVRPGTRLPEPEPHRSIQWLVKNGNLLRLVRAVNSWLNLQAVVDPNATVPKISQSDQNSILTIPGSIINGRSGAGGGELKNYDKDKIWKAGDWVWVKPNDPLCDLSGSGTVDPDSGLVVFATPGLYRVTRLVAPVTDPDGLPAGTYYRIPQWPPPQTSPPSDGESFDAEDAKLYFWLISNPPCI